MGHWIRNVRLYILYNMVCIYTRIFLHVTDVYQMLPTTMRYTYLASGGVDQARHLHRRPPWRLQISNAAPEISAQ